MPTAAILLAAGASTRLGSPKQLALINDEPLLERALRTAREAALSPILIVLGANAAGIQAACKLTDAKILLNHHWQEGMASSIRTGVAALAEGTEAVLLMTCDQPAVDSTHLRKLIQAGEQTGEAIASLYGEGENKRHGVPAYLPSTRFDDLKMLLGDTGARSLLVSAKTVDLNLGEIDVDTPEALTRARMLFQQQRG